MKRQDGFLIQQRRINSDDLWDVDPTEYPLETRDEVFRRLDELRSCDDGAEYRAVAFTLAERPMREQRKRG